MGDAAGVALSEITAIGTERALSFRLNRPASLSFRVASKDSRIAARHTDGKPLLAKWRTVKAYRRERQSDGTFLNILRFVGTIWQVGDVGDENTAFTRVTAFDPLQRLRKRLCRDASLGTANVVFDSVEAAQIAKTLVERANSVGATGLTTSGGTFEKTPERTVEYRYKRMADAFLELANAANGFDLRLDYLDATDGVHARISCLSRRGTFRQHAVFGWGVAPFNVSDIQNSEDGETAANEVTGLGATLSGADQLSSTIQNASSVGRIGLLEEVDSFSGISSPSFLAALVGEDLSFRGEGRQEVSIVPKAGLAPQPWTHFDIGDTFPIYAGPDLRAGFSGIQRCYGFDLGVDDEGVERVSRIIASPE